jgi:hypothetical protein
MRPTILTRPVAADAPRSSENPWAQATDLFLAVVVGTGFALSFEVLRGLPWFPDIALVISPPFNFQFWTLGLVYLAAILSSIATIRTGAKRPIRSQERFVISLVLLVIVLAQFTLFVNLGAILVLFALTFIVYVVWDLLSYREQLQLPIETPTREENLVKVRSGSWVSVTWAFVFAALAVVYVWRGDQPAAWALFWGYLAVCGYRLHKHYQWPFRKTLPPRPTKVAGPRSVIPGTNEPGV